MKFYWQNAQQHQSLVSVLLSNEPHQLGEGPVVLLQMNSASELGYKGSSDQGIMDHILEVLHAEDPRFSPQHLQVELGETPV